MTNKIFSIIAFSLSTLLVVIILFAFQSEKETGSGEIIKEKTKTYEALIMAWDKEETQKGDIIQMFPLGHKWSETEKNSYLIIKMNLTDKEFQEIMAPIINKNGEEVSLRSYKTNLSILPEFSPNLNLKSITDSIKNTILIKSNLIVK